ncbi:AraC family transcriptional regulator [Nocardiopsis sp. MG754419]|uniref:helix-turn-helix domain-containing protein n=1 Tax=Nocardiopsis sp. MG754419 TaxID=2259865 RepID=UPI001BA8F193|nr:AraC family transcriptional regulator [Nocardiopsis sp. MG754419]MBR8743267.1 AraC family transcriptional regulator [Nocardiopsis sp. MG754419]
MDGHADTVVLRPRIRGVAEVFHTHMRRHAYPMHTHRAWTLLIIDSGTVRYELGQHEHGALDRTVTLLPPEVPHNGTPVTAQGLRKRVLYLEPGQIDTALVGHAVDRPMFDDPLLRHRIHLLHGALLRPGEDLEAESRLALVAERLRSHLSGAVGPAPRPDDPGLAGRLRDLLDARTVEGLTLDEASGLLHAHPTHLARVFARRFGMPPHRYLVGRRVDLSRRLLLDGMAPKDVAATAGFHDQAHLNRHFTRVLGLPPGRYARARREIGPFRGASGHP